MNEILTKYLSTLNPNIIIVALIVVCFVCWVVFKNRKTISDFFNNLYNRRKNKEELLKTIHENQTEIKQIIENRIHDRQQSLIIQKELTDAQKELFTKQNELSNLVSEIVKSGFMRDEQINSLKLANRELLAGKINEKYKYYISIDGIPEDEVDEFTNLHTAYKAVGGNHSGDTKYEYVIEHLSIIPVESKLILERKKQK